MLIVKQRKFRRREEFFCQQTLKKYSYYYAQHCCSLTKPIQDQMGTAHASEHVSDDYEFDHSPYSKQLCMADRVHESNNTDTSKSNGRMMRITPGKFEWRQRIVLAQRSKYLNSQAIIASNDSHQDNPLPSELSLAKGPKRRPLTISPQLAHSYPTSSHRDFPPHQDMW